MDKITILQAIQDSEINFQILTFWDMGFIMQLGDETNGIKIERDFENLADGVDWLVEQVKKHYPKSTFVKNYII